MPSLTNVIAYSAQLGALAIAALLATHALRLRAPLAALRFWQAILAASLALPWLQPRATDPATETSSAAMTSSMSAFLMDAAVSRRHDIAEWVLIIVLTGSALRLLWLAIGMLRLRSITRHASLDRSLDDMLCELSSSLGTKASIAISDAIQSPSTVGVRRPLILLPPRVLEMSPPVQRAVIAHELVHVRRRDWLHTIAEEIWCALLWFHPAARLIASRLALARETLVDQTTILLTRDRRSYAEALLAFSNPQRGTPAARFGRGMETYLPGVTPLIGRRQLSQRISLIAQEDVMSRARLGVSFAVALLIAGAATASAINAFADHA